MFVIGFFMLNRHGSCLRNGDCLYGKTIITKNITIPIIPLTPLSKTHHRNTFKYAKNTIIVFPISEANLLMLKPLTFWSGEHLSKIDFHPFWISKPKSLYYLGERYVGIQISVNSKGYMELHWIVLAVCSSVIERRLDEMLSTANSFLYSILSLPNHHAHL